MSNSQYQASLFNDSDSKETIVLKKGDLDLEYQPSFVGASVSHNWFEQLLTQTQWQQDVITVYGKQHLTPRLSCWMGEDWMSYSYSQHTMQPQPWQALPLEIKGHIEAKTGETFNSVLINYYRDGKDSNGWHADDEPELGPEPIIASLSLGGARDFHLREKSDHSQKIKLNLEPGSLLIMKGRTQTTWQHHIPKRAQAAARINLTFRTIISQA